MSFDVKSFVSDYLKRKYPRPCITVMEGCCRKCLRGTPVGYNLKKKSIKELMDDGEIDPYQIASAFHIGSAYQPPCFKDSVINMKSEAKPCKYPGNCELKCVLCFSLIVNKDDIELDIWSGFKVHKACTSLCLFPCCQKRLPTLPAYLSLQRSALMCDIHKDSSAFHKLSISTATAVQERREAMLNKKAQNPTPNLSPKVDQPKPMKQLQQISPIQEPKVPNQPSGVLIISSEPAVRKTFSFKKPLGKAKADKFDERGKSRSILKFFQTPKAALMHAKKIANEDALKASKSDEAPRRFLRDKETGEVYGEWRGDHAYHIDTNELLFTRDQASYVSGRPVKLDFSPPITLQSGVDMSGASDEKSVPSNEEEQDEGESSP